MLKFSRNIFSWSYIFVVGAIHESLSPGSYHHDKYGRALWLLASVFIVKSERHLLQKCSCERAMAAKDGTRCGGKKDASISMERSSDTLIRTEEGMTVLYNFAYFLSGFLENCAVRNVLAFFSARKFTVFLFIIEDALWN